MSRRASARYCQDRCSTHRGCCSAGRVRRATVMARALRPLLIYASGERRFETGCRRSGCERQRRRAPIPDFGRLAGRMTAVPRNLLINGGRANGKVHDLVATPGQRPLPMAANWDLRPKADLHCGELAAPEARAAAPRVTAELHPSSIRTMSSNSHQCHHFKIGPCGSTPRRRRPCRRHRRKPPRRSWRWKH